MLFLWIRLESSEHPQNGISIAPSLGGSDGMEITGLLTKEKLYVVDDHGSFIGSLAARFYRACRWRTNSPSARGSARCVDYQSRLWSQSDLITNRNRLLPRR